MTELPPKLREHIAVLEGRGYKVEAVDSGEIGIVIKDYKIPGHIWSRESADLRISTDSTYPEPKIGAFWLCPPRVAQERGVHKGGGQHGVAGQDLADVLLECSALGSQVRQPADAPGRGRRQDVEGRVGTNTVRMTAEQLDRLKSSLMDGGERESSAFMTSGYFENRHGIHFNVRDIFVPDERDYEARTTTRLCMSPKFFNRVLTSAERDGVTVIQSHTHPFSGPGLEYSATDYRGESESAGTVRSSLGDVPMGSLLLGRGAMIGRVWTAGGRDGPRHEPIHELRVVGRRLSLLPLARRGGAAEPPVDEGLYDRQIRALGREGQRALSRARVGVAGAGGTGSAVAEQLARAGVKHLTILDRDRFAKSNMARMYGTDAGTGRRPKADIVGGNIKRIAPDAEVVLRCADICSPEALSLLKDCDVVLGCVDRREPRRALNDLAYRFFIPVIDMGVGIDVEGGRIAGGAARVNIAGPSLPCLLCSGAVDGGGPRAGAGGTRGGGARAAGGPAAAKQGGRGCDAAPSIVPLTTMAASCAVLVLKDMLLGITESDSCMLVFDLRTMSTRALSPKAAQGCACASAAGMGDCSPLPPAQPPALRPAPLPLPPRKAASTAGQESGRGAPPAARDGDRA